MVCYNKMLDVSVKLMLGEVSAMGQRLLHTGVLREGV